jgi:hypothetical protein
MASGDSGIRFTAEHFTKRPALRPPFEKKSRKWQYSLECRSVTLARLGKSFRKLVAVDIGLAGQGTYVTSAGKLDHHIRGAARRSLVPSKVRRQWRKLL